MSGMYKMDKRFLKMSDPCYSCEDYTYCFLDTCHRRKSILKHRIETELTEEERKLLNDVSSDSYIIDEGLEESERSIIESLVKKGYLIVRESIERVYIKNRYKFT
jgi:hypothetical protein